MSTSTVGAGELEDHLRTLILNNADPVPGTSTQVNNQPLEDQPIASEKCQEAGQPATRPQGPAKGGKKRPNQAQRRQMQAQLSIPVDTRPSPPHDERHHPNTHQHRNQHSTWHNGEQHTSRPHANTYHSGFQDRASTTNNLPFSHQRRQGGSSQSQISTPNHQSPWRQHQHQQHHNSDSFSKGVNLVSADSFPARSRRPSQPALYNPGGQRQLLFSPEQLMNQSDLLDRLCHSVVSGAEIAPNEIAEKENFRFQIEAICREVISRHEIEIMGSPTFQPYTVQLKCFGSLSSGFATKASDMDLGLLSPMSHFSPDSSNSPIPRLVEKALLDHGFGARLLTRTRVPIIKLCEKPTEKLHRDLVEARSKWETGFADDGHEIVDDVIEDQDTPEVTATAIVAEVDHSLPGIQHGNSQPMGGPVDRSYEAQLASLKQSETQSLMAYYGNAKRLLRRLNSRDVTISNATDLKSADYKVLGDISGAFINGLYDADLRSRLLSYPSVHSSDISDPPNLRSLSGVLMIVEGEKLVMLWESQVKGEGNPKLRHGSESVIQSWKNFQNRRLFGKDPLLFNRDVHVAVERLRQIPLVQLVQLKQDAYESPTQYYLRVSKIATDLGSANSSSSPAISAQAIQYYISGIRDKVVREQIQDFATSSGVQSLRTIARKHKTLHLITDYERAIDKNLYCTTDLPIIKEYISILRDNFVQRGPSTDEHIVNVFDFTVAVTESNLGIVDKIKQLPDPSKLSPNQPRDRYHDNLEFPKNGIGVQCDINFSAHLALQNTALLRCYSYTDPRVRPMVLFVKHWAKARAINTPYRGTLSSYGYVLMVLHYLVNIAEPFVCPNLQHLAPPDPNLPAEALEGLTTCKGRNVRFWRDEQEIQRLAAQGQLNQNQESLGSLLRGFFEYYAQNNMMSTTHKRGFDWGRDVLSLQTLGGLLSKQEKGWIGAKTVIQPETGGSLNPVESEANNNITGQQATTNNTQPKQPSSPNEAPITPIGQQAKPKEFKEVRYRYLFAIEDPFELEHNVARTVTHNGIVSIRDEFRRAWRIIRQAGKTGQVAEDLLQDVEAEHDRVEKLRFTELLEEIHGPRTNVNANV
ncbi:uncharacterized protein GGS25DRAFT_517239 [Hypoxylon fragiforme]|uniref:uncharacterized protein n=1 Tax=Hypoxylon fragiforme TaxID=63214 RepID=UPI0020C64DB5|nr:uncharacterized protein GGS25DRAFT_517239 [Hypoxylon fragiforme]KAI2614391.1 hypothetical protein GGS25DRAFT_517239 [Hypoxylon fragiforme]